MTDSLNTHGGLTEDSLSEPVRTHDRKGREGKGSGDRKGYPSLTLVNADTREGSFVSVGQVIDAGLWASGKRHDVIRTGERTPIPSHVRAAVWFRDKGRCRLCPPDATLGEWHLDHIKPWSAGGPDTTDNLRVLCATHNLERSNQIIPDERPEVPATWWCERCYMRNEHSWEYPTGLVPICPIHRYTSAVRGGMVIDPRCTVQRMYAKALEVAFETGGDFPDWHRRDIGLVDLHTTAYCAHCKLRGLTGWPL